MFQDALKLAQGYTCPVVVSFRTENGNTGSKIGAFMVLNEDGWILTANHIVEDIIKLNNQTESYHEYVDKLSEINSDRTLEKSQRRKKLRSLTKPNKDTVIGFSPWWGRDGWTIDSFQSDKLADIAIGKINGFDRRFVKNFPEFKNPSINFDVGENLCKLGFPFHTIEPTYDETTNAFQLPKGAVPLPLFPIEGIFTRTVVMTDGPCSAELVETSSPGLRGQSGGPTFDAKGRVWAMQSRTKHYPLGFSPLTPDKKTREHQFLNVGWGTHSSTIVNFLKANNVKFNLSQD